MSVVAAGGHGGSGMLDLVTLSGGVKWLLGRDVAWGAAGGACGLGCWTEAVAVAF